LQQNRTLAKAPVTARSSLQELVARAAQRVGVSLRGDPVQGVVEVAVPLVTQALALAIDAAAGLDRRRSIELVVTGDSTRIQLGLPLAADAKLPGEALAIAAWVFARAGGDLRCGSAALSIRLPLVSG
jgi:hypothetical protein